MLLKANIKARRLGYLAILRSFLGSDKCQPYGFVGRFGNFALLYGDLLKEYDLNQGEIIHENLLSSTRPYISLARDFKLIEYRSNKISIEEEFLKIHSKDENPFFLSRTWKQLFLDRMIQFDPVGLAVALYVIPESSISFYELKSLFQNKMSSLFGKIEYNHFLANHFDDLMILNSNLGLEAFLFPRLHWYFDFGWLDIKYSFTKEKRTKVYLQPKIEFRNMIGNVRSLTSRISHIDAQTFKVALNNLVYVA